MAFGFGDTEADGNNVVPRWVGDVRPVSKIVSDMELQFVSAGSQRSVDRQHEKVVVAVKQKFGAVLRA